MKELGITKGEFRLKTNVHPTTDGKRWGWVGLDKVRPHDSVEGLNVTWEEETKSEANAVLIVDTFNTAQKTGLLPSELLERYNEAIAVMSMIRSNNLRFGIDSSKRRVLRLDDEEWGLLEQTISKANRE